MISDYTGDDYIMMERLHEHRIAKNYNMPSETLGIDFTRIGDIIWADVSFQEEVDRQNEQMSG